MIKIFYDIRLTIQRHEHIMVVGTVFSDHYAHCEGIIIYTNTVNTRIMLTCS